jgi:hypothetical protein
MILGQRRISPKRSDPSGLVPLVNQIDRLPRPAPRSVLLSVVPPPEAAAPRKARRGRENVPVVACQSGSPSNKLDGAGFAACPS